ncbi:MAG: PaaI family thioesterase [Chloroflexi bacterium]|nr:MAG: PaaI family thioesterase [Chloroflexota bacterium]
MAPPVVRQPRAPRRPHLDRSSRRGDRRPVSDRVPTDSRLPVDRIHRNRTQGSRARYRAGVEIPNRGAGHRPRRRPDSDRKRWRERAHSSRQRRDGLRAHRTGARATPPARIVSDAPYGVRTLPELYKEWAASGMIANIGTRLVEIGSGTLVLEGNLTAEAHGFPTSRGPIVHGGAIATLADETLASVAFTLAEEGETTATADLKVDYYRPGKPGRLICRARVRHRTRRLAFCEASVEQESGEIIAEARAVIAYVRA